MNFQKPASARRRIFYQQHQKTTGLPVDEWWSSVLDFAPRARLQGTTVGQDTTGLPVELHLPPTPNLVWGFTSSATATLWGAKGFRISKIKIPQDKISWQYNPYNKPFTCILTYVNIRL